MAGTGQCLQDRTIRGHCRRAKLTRDKKKATTNRFPASDLGVSYELRSSSAAAAPSTSVSPSPFGYAVRQPRRRTGRAPRSCSSPLACPPHRFKGGWRLAREFGMRPPAGRLTSEPGDCREGSACVTVPASLGQNKGRVWLGVKKIYENFSLFLLLIRDIK